MTNEPKNCLEFESEGERKKSLINRPNRISMNNESNL
jgi:hypothetical protein